MVKYEQLLYSDCDSSERNILQKNKLSYSKETVEEYTFDRQSSFVL